VDAFVVRMTLVPALMTLFGKAAWWYPRPLDRITPNVDVEGQTLARHIGQSGQPERVPQPV
jgi:putative drug exporter of the RND superfamily